MHYLITVERQGQDVALSMPVTAEEAAYLKHKIIPALRPLTREEYMFGPAAILHTLARFSYVVDEGHVYWCIEWEPGLLVIRFSTNGEMEWASAKSPNPEFGGRQASEAELERFDENAPNPQYNLVFDAWDAEFDRDARGFTPASSELLKRYEAAMNSVDAIGAELQENYAAKEAYAKWSAVCKQSPIWIGAVATVPA